MNVKVYKCGVCEGRVFYRESYELHGNGMIERYADTYCENGCETKRGFFYNEEE